MITLFHTRFSGSLSLEQQLQELTYDLPRWLQPLYKLVLPFINRWIRKIKIARTMAIVDQQSTEIKQQWQKEERTQVVQQAVAKAQALHPDAHVEAISMPNHPTDAVYIEHPPTPGHKTEELLGFSSIEIKSPWSFE